MTVQTRCPICSTTARLPATHVLTLPGSVAFQCRACRRIAVTAAPPAEAPLRHPEALPPGPIDGPFGDWSSAPASGEAA